MTETILDNIEKDLNKIISEQEYNVFLAKDKIHKYNCDLIGLKNPLSNKDYVKKILEEYYDRHRRRSMGHSRRVMEYNKNLREKLNVDYEKLYGEKLFTY